MADRLIQNKARDIGAVQDTNPDGLLAIRKLRSLDAVVNGSCDQGYPYSYLLIPGDIDDGKNVFLRCCIGDHLGHAVEQLLGKSRATIRSPMERLGEVPDYLRERSNLSAHRGYPSQECQCHLE